MDENHLIAAFRYVALNPVGAGLVRQAVDWPWSSTGAHISGKSTPYVTVEPALSRVGNFAAFVRSEPDRQDEWSDLLRAELIGRPVGDKAWVEDLERQFGRTFSPQRRGPKPGGGSLGVETSSDDPLFGN